MFNFPGGAVGALSFTFDDGLAEQFGVGRRLLEEHGVRGTFFVVPGLVRNRRRGCKFLSQYAYTTGPRSRKVPKRQLASWDDIQAAHGAGHEIGNHSMYHTLAWWDGDDEAAVSDAKLAQSAIEAKIGVRPVSWCWPYYKRPPTLVDEGVRSLHAVIRDEHSFLGLNDLSTRRRTHGWINKAVALRTWMIFVVHGIGDGVDRVRQAVLGDAIRYAAGKAEHLWVAPLGEIGAYIRSHA